MSIRSTSPRVAPATTTIRHPRLPLPLRALEVDHWNLWDIGRVVFRVVLGGADLARQGIDAGVELHVHGIEVLLSHGRPLLRVMSFPI